MLACQTLTERVTISVRSAKTCTLKSSEGKMPCCQAPYDGMALNDVCTLKPNEKVHLRPGQSFQPEDKCYMKYVLMRPT